MSKDRRRLDNSTATVGRLLARPTPVTDPAAHGTQPLRLGTARDGILYVPQSYQPGRAAPLALMLHGAGGSAHRSLDSLQPLADATGIIMLVPDSRGRTWDIILGAYGPDIDFIDRALAQTFQRYAVDPARVAAGGFSDGASYALSIGITNGDLFTHVIAFSPGFMAPAAQHGAPRLFISHGTRDDVLPVARCSRKIVPQVQAAGYDVQYQEFDGPHTVPPEIARAAMEWFTGAAEPTKDAKDAKDAKNRLGR